MGGYSQWFLRHNDAFHESTPEEVQEESCAERKYEKFEEKNDHVVHEGQECGWKCSPDGIGKCNESIFNFLKTVARAEQ